jgi:hypothetical protein
METMMGTVVDMSFKIFYPEHENNILELNIFTKYLKY